MSATIEKKAVEVGQSPVGTPEGLPRFPMTPECCDLTDFEWMPLSCEKLKKSKAWLICKRKPALAFYMINLWTSAWHEVPAASIEDDDDVLADKAMCYDMEVWASIKADVLRGFVKCADGRLYHEVIAIKALEAWLEKLSQRLSSGAGNAKRWNTSFDPTHINLQYLDARARLQILEPMSKALNRKRTAPAAAPAEPAAPAPAATTPKSKPRKPVDNAGQVRESHTDPDGIARDSKETVKGQGEEYREEGGQPPAPPGAAAPLPDTPPITPKPVKNDGAAVTAPDWLPAVAWADFIAMRKAMGKQIPFTEAAARGVLTKLKKLQAEGHEPGAVLERSVMNGWRDVFPLPVDGGGFRPRVPAQSAGLSTIANGQAAKQRLMDMERKNAS